MADPVEAVTGFAPVRDIGTVKDVYGYVIRVGVDHDAVTIGGAAYAMLGPEARDDFAKLYFAADEAAKAWAAAQEEAAEAVPSEGDVAECGYCATRITLIDGQWTTGDGTIACTDTSAPFVPHKPKEG